jgi:RHS repeat-associated protein
LWKVTDWAGRVTEYVYDGLGRQWITKHANGSRREIRYDIAGQVEWIKESDNSGKLIALTQFTGYYLNGQPKGQFSVPKPLAVSLPVAAMTYSDDNRVMTFNGEPVVHDPNGNVTTGPAPVPGAGGLWPATASFGFDHRNRLTGVTVPGTGEGTGSWGFGYNAESNLTSVTRDGQTGVYQVNPAGAAGLSQVLVSLATNGDRTFYVYGATLLYEVSADASGVELVGTMARRTYHYDQRGCTMALSAADGKTVTDRWEYSAYGMVSNRWSKSGITPSSTPFRFNGAFGIATVGPQLLNMRARWYHPGLMRFLSEDPIGFGGGMNWYAFVEGDPVMQMDPTGLVAYAFPPQYAQSSEFREGFNRGAAAAVPAGLGIGAAMLTGPIVGGAALSAGINASNQILNMHQGTQQSFSGAQMALHGTVGAVVPAVLNRAVPAVMSRLPNRVKGTLGEGFTWINGGFSGRGWTPLEQRVLSIAGRRPRPDFTYPGMGSNGSTLYVEAKFGTSSLTPAQRVAANRLGENWITEKWTYGWMGSTAASAGNVALGIGNMIFGSGGSNSTTGGGSVGSTFNGGGGNGFK